MPGKTKEQKALHEALRTIKKRLRVTKVVCTRSVKGRGGDHYVGFSAGWDSVQDDGGGGVDLASAQDAEGQAAHDSGMTLREARLAAYAGAAVSEEAYLQAVRAIKANYSQLMTELFAKRGGTN